MFSHGPFTFEKTSARMINGEHRQGWNLSYGSETIAEKTLAANATRPEIVEHFGDALAEFRFRANAEHAPDEVHLISIDEEDRILSVILMQPGYASAIGLTPGLIDNRSNLWLRSADKLRSREVSLPAAMAIATNHSAPPLHWVSGLLSDDVLKLDVDEWRPPSSWEIRHIVGEGSFTGITGAKAAELIGMAPQNFRKYLAGDDAKNRQNISFSAWHLLLHRLGVQKLRVTV